TGPSGSGKTTLLTLIGGLRTVQHGRLTVLNHDLHEATPQTLIRVRREIGFIFQMHNLLEFLTVRQNVEFAFDLHPQVSKADARCRSENILRTVGLGDHLDHLPSKLSTGQRQRVTIARALAPKPKLVLADEPTSALDRQAGRNVVQLLENLARDQDSSILMVTHDNRVLDLADRIVEMEDGRVSPQS
ncbi:MAG: ATP-binding cassette domain-containing protein, partial [Planctomycetes bacterium]|nr:ATP-binding cassette domain-containing protein [Planctomycetota bacterium]